ncbi:MAG TPA: sialidase family protein [Actinomycetes bacterium]|nr:sialidase family protein [Actinomycetes bacterium]
MRRFILAALAVFALAISACSATTPNAGSEGTEPTGPSLGEQAGEDPGEQVEGEEGEEGRSGADEVIEEANQTQERLDALAEASANGTFGSGPTSALRTASGWSSEQLLNPGTDDWEPAVAADPRQPYVYLATTRYGTEKTCPKHCPSPFIALTRSNDGGDTWSKQEPLCVCRGSGGQYDPTLEVVPNTGFVYSVMLNADRAGAFSTAFLKSTDHGQTWTDPVHVYGHVSWTDKPEITSSPSGKDVYVSWNGPQGGDPYVGVSHDYGKTWAQEKLVTSKRYYYAYDATVLPDGVVVFSESSLDYSGPGSSVEGPIWHHAIISRDHGSSWENVIVDKVQNGEACVADGCSSDFYTGQASVTSDVNGHLVFAYEGASVDQGPQQIYIRTSNDDGRTWGGQRALSVAGENATGPRLTSDGSGDARIWYMQTSNGDDPDAWNVWYRSSSDGGKTWSSPLRLSNVTSGPGYKSADGFAEIYGDYGEIDVTSEGNTIAAWGEGFSYLGPGGTWYALQN